MKNTITLGTNDIDIKKAATVINKGGLVIFPTETVYGIGADCLNTTAVYSIFSAKGRPQDNPLIVHIKNTNIETLQEVATDIPAIAITLLQKFSPGPLTVVLKRNKNISPILSADLPTIAVRVPAHPIAQKLLKYSNTPIAAPSANISGRPSPTNFTMAKSDMLGRVDAIIDGGECQHGLESTVVSFDNNTVHILRPGAITDVMIKSATGLDTIYTTHKNHTAASPGTKHPHYKPNIPVRLKNKINIDKLVNKNKSIAVILYRPAQNTIPYPTKHHRIHTKIFASIEDYARDIYKTFVEFETIGIDIIYVEAVPKEGLGVALMNRLERASDKG